MSRCCFRELPRGQENGASALATLLSKLSETGGPVLIKRHTAGYAEEVDVCEVAADDGSEAPAAGWLILEISVGVEHNADRVIHADPGGEYGTWGSDLRAELILTGAETDWPLVNRVWATLINLWSVVAWDEMSGFEVNKGAPAAGGG